MTDAQLVVASVGPLVSLQDAGRFGRLRFGVTDAGPMDRLAHAAANLAIGNESGATAIEVSVGGLSLECRVAPVTVGVAGGGFVVQRGGEQPDAWTALTLRPGERLTVRRGEWGELGVRRSCWNPRGNVLARQHVDALGIGLRRGHGDERASTRHRQRACGPRP